MDFWSNFPDWASYQAGPGLSPIKERTSPCSKECVDRNGVLLLPLIFDVCLPQNQEASTHSFSFSIKFISSRSPGWNESGVLPWHLEHLWCGHSISAAHISCREAGKLVSEASPSGYCLVDRYRVERLGEKGGLQGVLWGLVVSKLGTSFWLLGVCVMVDAKIWCMLHAA